MTELKKPEEFDANKYMHLSDNAFDSQFIYSLEERLDYERACKELALEALERITNGELENSEKAMNGGELVLVAMRALAKIRDSEK